MLHTASRASSTAEKGLQCECSLMALMLAKASSAFMRLKSKTAELHRSFLLKALMLASGQLSCLAVIHSICSLTALMLVRPEGLLFLKEQDQLC